MKLISSIMTGIAITVLLMPGTARTAVAPDAATVQLKKDCGSLPDCFDSLPAMVDWLNTVRQPDDATPLLVEIDPGRYQGPFQCLDHGYITLRGSGRGNTVIYGDKGFIPGNILFAPGMNLVNCNRLSVIDLRIEGDYGAIWWDGSGETVWTDVDVEGGGRGWYEFGNCDPATTRHTWYGSRVTSVPYVTSSVAYSSFCGEAVFLDTELSAYGTAPGQNGFSWGDLRALWVQGGTSRMYGGRLHSRATIQPVNTNSIVESVRVRDGEALLSNTAIEIENTIDYPVTVFLAESGGHIHVESSGYRLLTDAAPVTRLMTTGGTLQADHDWGSRMEPPAITSLRGADRYLETDCDTSGCQLPGTEFHPMIYDPQCTASGPWFDQSTGRCRGL